MVLGDYPALQTAERYPRRAQAYQFFQRLVSPCVRRFLAGRVIVSHRDRFFRGELLFTDTSRDSLLFSDFR